VRGRGKELMRRQVWIGTLVVALIAGGGGLRAGPPCCEPAQDCFLQRLAPAGGWHPYGGGLLRWWPRHCFPCGGAPDDYCRKSLPSVCWPPYPFYYIWWAPPEIGCPGHPCGRAGNEPQAIPH
jgi:hypothetical protein